MNHLGLSFDMLESKVTLFFFFFLFLQTSKVLSYLKLYIRTEEKDRLHTVNHYEHLRDTDPEEAVRIRNSVQEHLRLITKRIEQSIEMLKRHPDLEKKIKPEIGEYINP